MDHLKRKIDAGADYICTQLFFDNRDFYDFQERCDQAGHPGPDPRRDHAGHLQIRHDPDGRTCARHPLPRRSSEGVDRCSDDRSIAKVGIHWATEQCRDLLDHKVRGIHFYTLNKSDATRQIYENLGVKDSLALRV